MNFLYSTFAAASCGTGRAAALKIARAIMLEHSIQIAGKDQGSTRSLPFRENSCSHRAVLKSYFPLTPSRNSPGETSPSVVAQEASTNPTATTHTAHADRKRRLLFLLLHSLRRSAAWLGCAAERRVVTANFAGVFQFGVSALLNTHEFNR